MEHLDFLTLGFYWIVYSLLGWVTEVCWYAITQRRFSNRGVLSLPLLPSYGFTFVLLAAVLPSLEGRLVLQFLATLAVSAAVEAVADHATRRLTPRLHWEKDRDRALGGTGRGVVYSLLMTGICLLVYLVIHPMVMGLALLLPDLAKRITVIAVLVLSVLDLATVLWALHTGDLTRYEERQRKGGVRRLGQMLTDTVWRRFKRAYPGIDVLSEEDRAHYAFAQGLCLDKLVWVFLAASLLGCVIEFFYCGLTHGTWMNRSSLLYGPFSLVWGLGAALLTVALLPLSEKHDRWVFGAGFLLGGAYEYMCSVFTELVFGTVFWDYSDMPLNIGGRTNVLFCFFWGVLAVIWVKLLYPPLSRTIERLPALTGKLLTWALLVFMVCNAALTGAAMLRYHSRIQRPQAENAMELFLDTRYTDAYMERRWPNMIVTEQGGTAREN